LSKNNDQLRALKNSAVHSYFRWQSAPRFKYTVGPAPALHKQLQLKV